MAGKTLKRTDGFIYVAKCRTDESFGAYVKIGYALNPQRRVAALVRDKMTLQVPGGSRPMLIEHFPGTFELEQRIHQELAAERVAGEWYRLDSPMVQAVIGKLRELAGDAIRFTPAPEPVLDDDEPAEIASVSDAARAMGRKGGAAKHPAKGGWIGLTPEQRSARAREAARARWAKRKEQAK